MQYYDLIWRLHHITVYSYRMVEQDFNPASVLTLTQAGGGGGGLFCPHKIFKMRGCTPSTFLIIVWQHFATKLFFVSTIFMYDVILLVTSEFWGFWFYSLLFLISIIIGQNNDLGHLVVSQHLFMYILEENVYPLLPYLCMKSLDLWRQKFKIFGYCL